MKRILTIICLSVCSPTVIFAQTPSTSRNFVMETLVKTPNKKTSASLVGLPVDSANRTVSYFDGLGRPLQMVQWQGSPDKKDVVSFNVYDALGREAMKYLPYAEQTASDGSFRADYLTKQPIFYGDITGWDTSVVKTDFPYSKTVFEASPLNRVMEQGAPGAAWQPVPNSTSGRTIKPIYSLNAAGEVPLWIVNATGATGTTSYAANRLYKTVTRDENWIENKKGTTEEFKDLEGRVVMKRVWEDEGTPLSTHYIYDDLGNLRYVVPPKVTLTNFSENADQNFTNFIYGYHYDGRRRLIRKKVPGKGWDHMVYNRLDQLVLSQDSAQRNANEWLFTKYDALGRTVMTGIYNSASNRPAQEAAMESWQNAQYPIWEQRNNTGGPAAMGYTDAAFPNQSLTSYHTITYYDDYAFYGNSFPQPNGVTEMAAARTKGLVTGSRVNILGTTTMLLSVNYYDAEGRVVTSRAQNHLTNGTDVVNNTYNFDGSIATSTREHNNNGAVTTIANAYGYDHMGRKAHTRENINGQGEVVLSRLEYNSIGQLKRKGLHGLNANNAQGTNITLDASNSVASGQNITVTGSSSVTLLPGFVAHQGSSFSAGISSGMLQYTTYAYNERGWLKKSFSNEFDMSLRYNETLNGVTQQFNGNIANQTYRNDGTTNTFNYTYDPLNRLIKGEVSPTIMSEVITYDVMGNIASMNRDNTGPRVYSYLNGGNQLESVPVLGVTTYAYDANGNARIDGRNGATLTYNYLNLPQSASVPGTGTVAYTYDAMGQKLKKVSSSTGTTDYVNGMHYTNNQIDFIQTEEGVARKSGNNYIYEYNLTDHLGNVRYTFGTSGGTINKLQVDNYYAFGKRNPTVVNANDNKYLYNGKELQEELLGQYDYGARFYDPVIGRWNVIDPLAELDRNTSPYTYVMNNPLRFIDPDGMFADYYDSDGTYLGEDGKDDKKVYVVNDGRRANKNNKSVNWGGRLSEKHSEALKNSSQEAEMPGEIGYSIDKGENASSDKYNKYDKEIAVATHLLNREINKGTLSVGDGYLKGTNATELDVNLVKALAYKESRLGQGQSVATNASDIFSMFHIGDYGDKYKMGMTLNDVKTGSGPLKSTYWGVRWLHFKSYMSEDGKTKNFQGWNYGVQKYGPGKKEPGYLQTVLKIYKSIE